MNGGAAGVALGRTGSGQWDTRNNNGAEASSSRSSGLAQSSRAVAKAVVASSPLASSSSRQPVSSVNPNNTPLWQRLAAQFKTPIVVGPAALVAALFKQDLPLVDFDDSYPYDMVRNALKQPQVAVRFTLELLMQIMAGKEPNQLVKAHSLCSFIKEHLLPIMRFELGVIGEMYLRQLLEYLEANPNPREEVSVIYRSSFWQYIVARHPQLDLENCANIRKAGLEGAPVVELRRMIEGLALSDAQFGRLLPDFKDLQKPAAVKELGKLYGVGGDTVDGQKKPVWRPGERLLLLMGTALSRGYYLKPMLLERAMAMLMFSVPGKNIFKECAYSPECMIGLLAILQTRKTRDAQWVKDRKWMIDWISAKTISKLDPTSTMRYVFALMSSDLVDDSEKQKLFFTYKQGILDGLKQAKSVFSSKKAPKEDDVKRVDCLERVYSALVLSSYYQVEQLESDWLILSDYVDQRYHWNGEQSFRLSDCLIEVVAYMLAKSTTMTDESRLKLLKRLFVNHAKPTVAAADKTWVAVWTWLHFPENEHIEPLLKQVRESFIPLKGTKFNQIEPNRALCIVEFMDAYIGSGRCLKHEVVLYVNAGLVTLFGLSGIAQHGQVMQEQYLSLACLLFDPIEKIYVMDHFRGSNGLDSAEFAEDLYHKSKKAGYLDTVTKQVNSWCATRPDEVLRESFMRRWQRLTGGSSESLTDSGSHKGNAKKLSGSNEYVSVDVAFMGKVLTGGDSSANGEGKISDSTLHSAYADVDSLIVDGVTVAQ